MMFKTKLHLFATTLAVGMTLSAACSDETPEQTTNASSPLIYLTDAQSGKSTELIYMGNENYETYIKAQWNEAEDAVEPFRITIDPSYLAEYNRQHATEFELYPESKVSFEKEGAIVPSATMKEATVKMTIETNEQIEEGKTYVVPLAASYNSYNETGNKGQHCLYLIKKQKSPDTEQQPEVKPDDDKPKDNTPKGFLYIEVNDVNPMNALSFHLTNGKLLWNTVVLFAANINKDAATGRPTITCNENVRFLLDNNEKFIQPLRRQGIKVLLGILGNHDETGVAQLSDAGARHFAKEVASYCEKYQLDGVNYDDEYSKEPDLSNPMLAPADYERAARLCYETKSAMPDKMVTVFSYGYMAHHRFPTQIEDKGIHEWLDVAVPNYGSRADGHGDFTNARCAYFSMEFVLNIGGDFDTEKAEKMLEGNYGWFMGFAPNPSNYKNIFGRLGRGGLKRLYGSDISRPDIYYKKNDATAYPYDSSKW